MDEMDFMDGMDEMDIRKNLDSCFRRNDRRAIIRLVFTLCI